MESAVCITTWRLNEAARQRAEEYFKHVWDGEHALVERLRDTDRVKSELVAAVSHEFRTPLTSILGFASAIQRVKPITDEQLDDYAQRIYRQGQRLSQLVDNLLEYDKPADGTLGSCDAAAAVDASVRLAPIADGASTVDTQVTPGLQLPVAPETAQLLLANLIGNAAKFRKPGTPIHVRVMPERRGGASIEVTNNGPAIGPESMARIFEPFVQGDSSNTRVGDGIGLGLHIVARIVDAADGEVRAHSADGTTTFTVWLPEPVAEGVEVSPSPHEVGLRSLDPLLGLPGD
jgi:signal transduction histidine kinase